MLKKIDHINISVIDIEKAKKFFIDLLGFKLETESVLEGERIDNVVNMKDVKAKYSKLVIPNTETSLELIQYYNPIWDKDDKISLANQIGFRHIAFEVKEIEKMYKELKEKWVNFSSELQVYNGSKKLCYFTWPDDIILELAEYN